MTDEENRETRFPESQGERSLQGLDVTVVPLVSFTPGEETREERYGLMAQTEMLHAALGRLAEEVETLKSLLEPVLTPGELLLPSDPTRNPEETPEPQAVDAVARARERVDGQTMQIRNLLARLAL